MLVSEWKAVFKNKFMVVALIAIAFVPALYNLIFLSSLWDPYGKVDQLPVAVVNMDQPYEFNGKKLEIGQTLVDKMEESGSMDFHFVSQAQADEGIQDGSYYLKIVIPKNFSQAATTFTTAHPQKVELQYETTQGKNYIASKMSSSAVAKLKEEVAQEITLMYTQTMLAKLSEIDDNLSRATDGTSQLQAGSTKILDGNYQLKDGLEQLAQGTISFTDGSQTFSQGLNTYLDGVVQLANGQKQLGQGIGQLQAKVPTLVDGVNQLASGSQQLDKGVKSYTEGVAQAHQGSQALVDKSEQLSQGVTRYQQSLKEGAEQLNQGVGQLQSGLTTLVDKMKETGSMSDLNDLQDGIDQFSQALSNYDDQVQQASVDIDLQAMTETLADISSQVQAIVSQVQALPDSVPTSVTVDNSAVVGALRSTATYQSLTPEQQGELVSSISAYTTGQGFVDTSSLAASVQSIQASAQSVSEMTQSIANQAPQLTENAQEIIGQLKAQTAQLDSAGQSVLTGSKTAISGFTEGIGQVQVAMTGPLLKGTTSLSDGLDQLVSGIEEGGNSISSGFDQYRLGVSQLNDGLNQLEDNSSNLTAGSTQLAGGLGTLTDSLPSLTQGVAQLGTGANQLVNGSNTLVANNDRLSEAVGQLTTGALALNEGTTSLMDGEDKLIDANQQVKDGIHTLNSQFDQGSKQLSQVNTTDEAAQAIAQPLQVQDNDQADVANNGTAMAPYMMSLALMIGAITFNVLYDAYTPSRLPKSGFSWWLSKTSVAFVVAILQAGLVYSVVRFLGMHPYYPVETVLFLMAEAVAYMMLVTLFNVLLGKVGAFVMLMLLILQLGGSGGTYPIQLSNGFFQWIHPYLPMTYAIDGLRQSISLGHIPVGYWWVFISLALVSNLSLWGYLAIKQRTYQGEDNRLIAKTQS